MCMCVKVCDDVGNKFLMHAEFSIPNVVNHIHHMCKLGTIKNWRVLGLILPGILPHDIDEISEYHERERIQRLVEAWICHGIEPSWELLQQKISEAAIRRESIESVVSIVPLSTPISTKGTMSCVNKSFYKLTIYSQ